MGLFDFGKKSKAVEETTENKQELLLKRKETLEVVLKTKNLDSVKARVVFVFDESGSMSPFFDSGEMQRLTERLMPIAITFDDNGEMECYGFSNNYQEHTSATKENFTNFIDKYVKPKIKWGGTNYAPIINKITNEYGLENPSTDPTFVIFQTDGDNFDKSHAKDALIKASNYNIFWKFIGLGSARKEFLEELDDMPGRVVDNANFFNVTSIDRLNDSDLYKSLMEEFDQWLNAATEKGIQ